MNTRLAKDVIADLRAGKAPPMAAMHALSHVPVTFSMEGNGDEAKSIKVNIKARQRGAIEHPWWGTVYHDLGTMRAKPKIAIDDTHDTEIGYGRPYQTEYGLEVEGVVVTNPDDNTHPANRIAYNLRNGIPQEGSIDFSGNYDVMEVPDGMAYPVNGLVAQGPCLVVMNWPLRAVAICKEGADDSTETQAVQLAGGCKDAPLPKTITTLALPSKPVEPETKKMTIKCESCNHEFTPADIKPIMGLDGKTIFESSTVCPGCKCVLDDKTGKKLTIPAEGAPAPVEAPPVVPPKAAAPVAAVPVEGEQLQQQVASLQTQLKSTETERDTERQRAEQLAKDKDELQKKVDAQGKGGAKPIPTGLTPGNKDGMTWTEAMDKVRTENPTLTEPQVFAKASRDFPKVREGAIIRKQTASR